LTTMEGPGQNKLRERGAHTKENDSMEKAAGVKNVGIGTVANKGMSAGRKNVVKVSGLLTGRTVSGGWFSFGGVQTVLFIGVRKPPNLGDLGRPDVRVKGPKGGLIGVGEGG